MRIDQFLQKTMGVSRQEARAILNHKKIFVNNIIIKQAKHQLDLAIDRIFYLDKELIFQEYYYWILNKPKGFVSSHSYDDGMPIYDLLADFDFVDMHCAGRLDKDTTGLVLITNDGKWSHRVTHPNQKCFKRYLVTLEHNISEESIAKLSQGINLSDGKTAPSKVEVLSPKRIQLEICEGKFHQIKRMLHAVDNEVTELHRDRIGNIELGDLSEGEYRALTDAEIREFL